MLGKGAYNTLDADAQSLFQVLKDHNSIDVVHLATKAYIHSIRKAAFKKGIVLPEEIPLENQDGEITNLVITQKLSPDAKSDLLAGLKQIRFTRLQVKVYGDQLENGEF